MDKRVVNFGKAIKALHSVHTRDDPSKSYTLTLQFPLNAIQYTAIGSYGEPEVSGSPIDTIWVELNISSPYYLKVLKLKRFNDGSASAQQKIKGSIKDQGYTHDWVMATTRDEILYGPIWYYRDTSSLGKEGPQGERGPAGPEGPQGEVGPSGVVDYPSALAQAAEILCAKYGLCSKTNSSEE